ncbi:hypothetical protein Aperf_G00000058392 [Anoplocephala perfoliata]
MGTHVDLDITEAYLKLRLKAACIDSRALVQPDCSIYEPKILSAPVHPSALYELYHRLLKTADESYGSEISLWNVVYNRLSNKQRFVAFSTSAKGLTVRVEIHETQSEDESENLLVFCEPMIPLGREKFQLEELLEPRKFILDFIHPAILDELRDTKIIMDDETADTN